jgi:uridylate kinase
MESNPPKRILLKLSGEQLSGEFDVGIDPAIGTYLAEEVKKVIEAGMQIVLVVGGGNMVRGAKVAGNGIKRVTADQMGMLSGLINSMALTDIFEANGIRTRCMSNIYATQVAESYSFRLAEKHLERGRVIIIAGGLGRPYFTHDTAAVNLALELECDFVMKATKVDGVYDKDPAKFNDAQRLPQVSFIDAVSDDQIQIMDKAALGLAMEQHMPIVVFDAMQADNIVKAATGQNAGTKIS